MKHFLYRIRLVENILFKQTFFLTSYCKHNEHYKIYRLLNLLWNTYRSYFLILIFLIEVQLCFRKSYLFIAVFLYLNLACLNHTILLDVSRILSEHSITKIWKLYLSKYNLVFILDLRRIHYKTLLGWTDSCSQV